MNKKISIGWMIFIILVVLLLTLIILFICGFSFMKEKPLGSYRDISPESMEVENVTLYFPLLNSLEPDGGFPRNVIAVKKYGLLYHRLEPSQHLYLYDENCTYVGSILRYSLHKQSACVILWGTRMAVVDGNAVDFYHSYTEEIEVNRSKVSLEHGFFFRLDGKIQEVKLDGKEVKLYDDSPEFSPKELAPIPEDSPLDFWITDDVAHTDFSEFTEIPGWFGAREYLGKSYKPEIGSNGIPRKPDIYVSYLVTAYPDYADGGQYITTIEITDPSVKLYGVSCQSTPEDFIAEMEKRGFVFPKIGSGNSLKAFKNGTVWFTLRPGTEDLKAKLIISVEVTNRDNIVY